MPQSSHAIKGRLGKALALFVSMPALAMPVAAQTTDLRKGTIGVRASGVVGVRARQSVGIRANQIVGIRAKNKVEVRARDIVGTKVRERVTFNPIKSPGK